MGLLFANRTFTRIWTAGLCFQLAWWALHAVMLIHVFELTGSPFATGLIPVFSALPGILLGPVAGVLVDRWSRPRVMAGSALSLVLLLLVAVPLASSGAVSLLYAIILIQSMVMTFFSPAENALLPSVVPEEDLRTANSLNALNDSLGRIIGPAVGAVMLVRFGFAATLVVSAAIYLAAWIVLLGLRGIEPVRAATPDPSAGAAPGVGVRHSFREGLSIVRGTPVLTALVVVSALIMVADVPMSAVLPAFMRASVGVSADVFGQLMSVRGLTGLLGGLLVVGLSRRLHEAWLLAGGLLVHGASYLAFGIGNNLPVSVLVLIPIGPAWAAVETGLFTMLQKASPEVVRGRVFALMGTINGIVVLTVSAAAGGLGEVFGTRAIVIGSGCLHLLPLALAIVILHRAIVRSAPAAA